MEEKRMEKQKKNLSLPQKLAYGSGDLGSNFFYMFVSSFAMIYMTNTIGLNAGIIGTLIMVSKLLDGFTDVIFESILDRTKSKMGKARPWMFFFGFPLAISMILAFAIPSGMGEVAQYVWFFIAYTCANALFYTANNISYATMSALITKNETERVSLGSFRYVFAVTGSILVSSITVMLTEVFGGGAAGWRTVAIIYAVILVIFNSLASLCVKELPQDDAEISGSAEEDGQKQEKISFWKLLKTVLSNKYYLLLLGIYLFYYTSNNLGTGIGVYYFTYVIGNANLLGVVSMASIIMIVGLIFNPALVKKFGMYRVNLYSYIITCIFTAIMMIFIYTANLGGIVVTAILRGISMAFLLGSLNALVAEVAQNNWLKNKIHTEGMMFSCSSIGMKVGSGLGAGMVGWLLNLVNFDGLAEIQPDSVLSMIKFIYGAVPLILTILITLCLAFMKVDSENKKLQEEIKS